MHDFVCWIALQVSAFYAAFGLDITTAFDPIYTFLGVETSVQGEVEQEAKFRFKLWAKFIAGWGMALPAGYYVRYVFISRPDRFKEGYDKGYGDGCDSLKKGMNDLIDKACKKDKG